MEFPRKWGERGGARNRPLGPLTFTTRSVFSVCRWSISEKFFSISSTSPLFTSVKHVMVVTSEMCDFGWKVSHFTNKSDNTGPNRNTLIHGRSVYTSVASSCSSPILWLIEIILQLATISISQPLFPFLFHAALCICWVSIISKGRSLIP